MTDPWGKGCGVEKIRVWGHSGALLSQKNSGHSQGCQVPSWGFRAMLDGTPEVAGWCVVGVQLLGPVLSTSGALTWLGIQT